MADYSGLMVCDLIALPELKVNGLEMFSEVRVMRDLLEEVWVGHCRMRSGENFKIVLVVMECGLRKIIIVEEDKEQAFEFCFGRRTL